MYEQLRFQLSFLKDIKKHWQDFPCLMCCTDTTVRLVVKSLGFQQGLRTNLQLMGNYWMPPTSLRFPWLVRDLCESYSNDDPPSRFMCKAKILLKATVFFVPKLCHSVELVSFSPFSYALFMFVYNYNSDRYLTSISDETRITRKEIGLTNSSL